MESDFLRDYTQEAVELMRKADAGDAKAQYHFAMYLLKSDDPPYYRMELSPEEIERGMRYLHLSAAQGYCQGVAADELGKIYYEGLIVPKDYKKAKLWYNTALLKGIPISAYMLGECAYYGYGEDVDYEKAAKYYLQAASGYVNAIIRLGDMYIRGEYLPHDPAFAKKLYDHVISEEEWLYASYGMYSDANDEVLKRLDNLEQSEILPSSAPIKESEEQQAVRRTLEEIMEKKRENHSSDDDYDFDDIDDDDEDYDNDDD